MSYVNLRAPLALAAVLLAAACSSTSGHAPPAAAPTTPSLPACSAVFKPGQVIDKEKAAAGCTDPDGGVQAVGSFRCGDGTHLWQVDAATGATAGYGRDGKAYKAVKGDVAADAGYKKAYSACVS